ncbi:pseudaminic acid synthase [Psychrosphaera sp. 1_MG-2023]|uniref:pseudaminic acid synthase n=1 Tax=Psychrosphaera sp. 1_MG-2023 TaxID=3062643 RepID=UPI0026E2C4C3|nr:pseudaminic acid synthase [Psychrosphaera sp. 1_MG-2023]MDO6718388.1 pseudaminic acid synthase [Psychrosphaera sp. 1_MG-2023]
MLNKSINVNGREINEQASPYIIAEISGNHKGDKERMFHLMREAAKAGFDAVKIQVFNADDMTLDKHDDEFVISSGLWQGRSLYDVYQEAATPESWFDELFAVAREENITLFPSIFSERGLALMEQYHCPIYKIASFEAMDIPLIEKVVATGKPVIISTGIIDDNQIDDLFTHIPNAKELILLHCISNYPAPVESFNLSTMTDIKHRFNCLTGLSDHSVGNTAAVVATALGAVAIEKHITVDQNDGAIDSEFSLPIAKFKRFIQDIRDSHDSLGQVDYSSTSPRKNYRSLYVVSNMKKGDTITYDNVKSIRPGHGLAPKHLDEVIGQPVNQAIQRGTPLDWSHIKS